MKNKRDIEKLLRLERPKKTSMVRVRIEPELLDLIKALGLNISLICRNALRISAQIEMEKSEERQKKA